MWQGIYDELKDRNFTLISVAFDTGGAEAVRPFIRPAEPIEIAPPISDIMGWELADLKRAAAPAYPCLIDEQHIVGELYNMTNVPMAVWIDENGRVVRPAEAAGASDGFRSMDRATWAMPQDVAANGKASRHRYVEAIRDWVAKGDKSEYVLSPAEARSRIAAPSEIDALATANFRLGECLRRIGHGADALPYFTEARRLNPQRWHYFRQTLELEETGKASGPDFFAAVDALGARPYYPPVALKGTGR